MESGGIALAANESVALARVATESESVAIALAATETESAVVARAATESESVTASPLHSPCPRRDRWRWRARVALAEAAHRERLERAADQPQLAP